jgi:hypothetical protein
MTAVTDVQRLDLPPHFEFLGYLDKVSHKKPRAKETEANPQAVTPRDVSALSEAWDAYVGTPNGLAYGCAPSKLAIERVALSRGKIAGGGDSFKEQALAEKKLLILSRRRRAAREDNIATRGRLQGANE